MDLPSFQDQMQKDLHALFYFRMKYPEIFLKFPMEYQQAPHHYNEIYLRCIN